MKRLLVITLLTLVALTALIYVPTSHAGEIIDYLPEMRALQSMGISWFFNVRNIFSSFETFYCFFIDRNTELPASIHHDENGEPHSEDMLQFYRFLVECKFVLPDNFNPLTDEFSLDDILPDQERFDTTVRALNGEAVALSNGNILDGTNQVVRAFLMFDAFYYWIELVDPESEIDLSSERDFCDRLAELAVEGTTESQFTSIFVLSLITAAEEEFVVKNCEPLLENSQSELVELAKTGDLDAAISYAINRLVQFGAENREQEFRIYDDEITYDEYSAYVDARLEGIGVEVLEYTARYPLLAMATAVTAFVFQLEVTDRVY